MVCISQVVNSNKNTVGQFFDGQVKAIELNGGKVTGQFRLNFISWTVPYSYKKQTEITSAKKHNTFFINLGITNSSDFLNLNKFDFSENNGFVVGGTFQNAFSEVYLATDSINKNPLPLRSWTVGINYQQDKFKNFDPTTEDITTATPDKLTLVGGWSRYKFKYRSSAKFKYSWVFNMNTRINIVDYNSTELQNYILNSSSTDNGTITFTESTSFDGKFGVLENSATSASFSISSPFVPDKSFWNLPILSPIPYAEVSVFEGNGPRWNAGIALGLLSTSLLDKERKIDGNNTKRKFKVPSFLTIGVDWNYQNSTGSKPNYFIAGSIKID